MTWLIALWGKTKFYALAAIAAVGALLVAYWRVREDGKNAVKLEQAQARDKLQEHYDEIDGQNVDPAASYDRLRGLSDDPRGR